MKSLLYWNNQCWLARAEASAVIDKRLHCWGESWETVPQSQHTEAVDHGRSRLHITLAAELGKQQVSLRNWL